MIALTVIRPVALEMMTVFHEHVLRVQHRDVRMWESVLTTTRVRTVTFNYTSLEVLHSAAIHYLVYLFINDTVIFNHLRPPHQEEAQLTLLYHIP